MSDKILIVRLSAIGDVIHALPALHALKTAFPDATVDWLVEDLSAQILKGHPMIGDVHVFRKAWRRQIRAHLFKDIIPFFKGLRARGYDWAIDFQGLTKSGLAAYFSGARRIIGFGDEDGREFNKLFTNVKVRPALGLHVVEKNLALLKPLGITSPEIVFPLPHFREEFPEFTRAGFAVINPGAGWPTKRIPLETLARLGAFLNREKGLDIIITWGPGEEQMTEMLLTQIRALNASAEAAPPTKLRQLCALISRAALYVGGDTGPTHMAAALGVPVLSFFGASDAKRNGPRGSRCITLQNRGIPCVPCWKTRCRFTDNRHIECLKSLSAENLIEAACSLLEMSEP